ncbi:MAG: sugar transferase [Candidatus Andersenbacteria bacterium]
MASKSLQRKTALFVVDAVLVAAAQLAALKLITRPEYFADVVLVRPWWFVLPVVLWLLGVYLAQGYHLEEIVQPWRGLTAMFLASLGAAVATGFTFFLVPAAPEFSARVLAALLVGVTLLLWLARLAYGRILSASTFKEHLLIIGAGESAQRLVEILRERQRSPYRIVGVVTDGSLHALPDLLRREHVDTVVLGVPDRPNDRLVRAVVALKRRGLKVTELTALFEELTGMVPVQYVGELAMLFQNYGQRSELVRLLEEVANRGTALVLTVLTVPLWLVIVLGQQLTSRGPIFVEKSDRVGLAGRTFRLFKFRSMVPNATAKGSALLTGKDDPRVTPFGRIIRKTHVDELPQLLNILRGDMHFIGPRAEYVENVQRLEQQIPFYQERHLIKPGLTGWAQVRNVHTSASAADTLEKIQYDLYYLKHRSLALDLAILLRTAKLVLSGRGTA